MNEFEKLNEEFKRKKANNKRENSFLATCNEIERKIKTCIFCKQELIDLKCTCKGFTDNEAFELRMQEEEEQRKEEIEKMERELRRQNTIDKLKIPKRYENVDLFNDWNIERTSLRDYINEISINVLNGYGLALFGTEGTGKTRMSFAVGLHIAKTCNIKSIIRIKFYNMFKLAMNNESEYERLKRKDVLILDEIGLKQLTDWEMQVAYDLLDHRNEEMLYTIITTNAKKEELSKFLGLRTYKRLEESCKFVEINGKSKRIRS